MTRNKRPISVTILALVYIGVGAVGFVYHFRELHANNIFHSDGVLVEVTEILAIISGTFILRGHNWARWLALAWIAFHVALSVGALQQLAMHVLIFGVIAWILLRPPAAWYFRRESA